MALCGGPLEENFAFRPLDYNDPAEARYLWLAETFHFTPEVEALTRGKSTALPPDDIDYVLRAFPNHYRALAAMARWQLQNKRPPDAKYLTIECYYERAFAFQPKDPQLYLGYATYLHRAKQLQKAREAYQKAEDLGSNSAELFYNRGLLEFDLGDRKSAQAYADKAYALGYPLPGLRNKLNSKPPATTKAPTAKN